MAKTTPAETASRPEKKDRLRSPNFPSVSLPEALKRVRAIYKADKLNTVPTKALLAHLGYGNSLTGSAGRMISALRQYGLLDDVGDDKYRVSQAAYRILELSESSPERKAAISTVARKPAIFQTLLSKYPDGLPSEHTLKDYLLTELRFNPGSVETFIRSLNGTIEFAKLTPGAYTGDLGDEGDANDMGDELDKGKGDLGSPEKELLQQRVSKDCVAKVLFQGKATQQAVEKLVAYLNLMKDTLPSES